MMHALKLDEKPVLTLVEARHVKPEDHIKLVFGVAKSYVKKGPIEDSDVFSDGCLGLMKAVDTYQPEKGAFSTWAIPIIKNEIVTAYRDRMKRAKLSTISLELDPVAKEEIPFELVHLLLEPSLEDTEDDQINRKILIDHFFEGLTWAEIGRRIGLTRERVRQRGNEALELLRTRLGDM